VPRTKKSMAKRMAEGNPPRGYDELRQCIETEAKEKRLKGEERLQYIADELEKIGLPNEDVLQQIETYEEIKPRRLRLPATGG